MGLYVIGFIALTMSVVLVVNQLAANSPLLP